MAVDSWRLFVQERLRAMDPTINLSEGAPASVQVVEPIVARLTPDPFETDVLLFILARMRQEHPQVFVDEGGALSDMFVKPMITMLEPFRREFKSISKQLSLENPEQLTSVEADRLMANFFMIRNQGTYARVKVRIYFQNPLSSNIGSTNVAFTGSGLRFLPTQAQSINAEEMLFNTDASGLYYFDVNFQAERPGTSYNIAASQIIGVTGLSAATRATNLAKAVIGINEETTTEFIDRGASSMGERSITTFPGMIAALREEFSTLSVIQAIGFNDAEMNRDIITGDSLGAVLYSGTLGSTANDGDSDGWTPYFDIADTNVDFTTALGPVGTDISGYQLEVWYNDATYETPHAFALKEVIGATQISISDAYDGATALPDSTGAVTISNAHWSIRKREVLTISDLPGGILFPDVATGEELTVPDNSVHVGGCTDVYVRGGDIEESSAVLTLVADENVIARRENAKTGSTSNDDEVALTDISDTEWDNIVVGETSLVLEEGADQGAYRIIEKVSTLYRLVRVSSDMQAPGVVTDISYLLVDDIDINLVSPREIRYEGDDLRTVAGLPIVETVSAAPLFASVGVAETDYIDILEGNDAGEYGLVAGGVNGNQLTIDTIMATSSSPLSYAVYRKEDGIELPLLRVKTVEILDSGLEPTGSFVPYRHPVDVQSTSFQNPGREAKVGTGVSITQGTYFKAATAQTDEIQLVDEDGVATGTDLYALGVRPGDIVNIDTTDNQGYYTVDGVGAQATPAMAVDTIRLTTTVRWPTTTPHMEYAIGPASYGSFRLYFLDPVTFEATYENALFSVELGSTTLRYRPDPDVWDEYLPSGTKVSTVGLTAAGSSVSPFEEGGATQIDLHAYSVQAGDRVEITYAPLVGSENLGTGGPYDLDGATLLIDVGNGSEVVTFSGTSLNVDAIVTQMNSQLSKEVASKFEDPGSSGDFYLMLRGDHTITIRDNSSAANDATDTVFGTNRQTWNTWFTDTGVFAGGISPNNETDNASPEKGFYLVSYLTAGGPTGVAGLAHLDGTSWAIGALPGGAVINELGHYIHFERSGRQRISSTAMSEQSDENGLYYFDVECVSEGYGNLWNIADDLQAVVEGYSAEGWAITTESEDTSYSMAEVPWLEISPRILIVGSEDDPHEKQEITGRSIQVVYERDPIVEQVNDYIRDPQNRVLVMNPLARSLLPTFVRTYIEYRSGATEDDVRVALAEFIESILPENTLEVDDLAKKIRDTGATKVTHPVTLLGIGHQRDRSIITERSVDQISSGRVSALIPDDDGTTSAGVSYISLSRSI